MHWVAMGVAYVDGAEQEYLPQICKEATIRSQLEEADAFYAAGLTLVEHIAESNRDSPWLVGIPTTRNFSGPRPNHNKVARKQEDSHC